MPILTSQQRKVLEDACTKGRRAAEQAVRAALISLEIAADRPPAHLNEDGRALRRGLRAKARQLGDLGNTLDSLVAECAYEQWHRLLFARFLAENNLLIHPEYRAPVTLNDCNELAESLGEPDGWSVAGRFAAEILPGIFRPDDPCVRVRLAPEGRLSLESIVDRLPTEVFACRRRARAGFTSFGRRTRRTRSTLRNGRSAEPTLARSPNSSPRTTWSAFS